MSSQSDRLSQKSDIVESILQQEQKLDEDYDHMKKNLTKKESLVADMLDYLTDNQSIDLESHFPEKSCSGSCPFCFFAFFVILDQFMPSIFVENRCLKLPDGDSNIACPLSLEGHYIKVLRDEIRVVLKVLNHSDRLVKDIVCTIFKKDDSNAYICASRCCLLKSIENTYDQHAITFNENQLIYADELSPQQRGYLVVSFEPCSEKQYVDLVLRCKLSTERCPSAIEYSSNGFKNRWSSWCGTLDSSLHVDPWTNDGKRLGVDRVMLTLIVASRLAFIPCWFVEITTNVDIIEASDILALTKLADDIFISDSDLLPSFTILRHRKVGEKFNKENDKFVYSLCCPENIADKFFRRILSLKLCTKVDDFDTDDVKISDSNCRNANAKDFVFHKIDALIEKSDEKISGGVYRKIRSDLCVVELQNL